MQAAQLTHTGIEVVPIVTGQFLTARTQLQGGNEGKNESGKKRIIAGNHRILPRSAFLARTCILPRCLID